MEQALLAVRQQATRPSTVFDPFALIGALQHLEDMARRAGHPDLRRFTAVLTECKKLPPSNLLGEVVTRLLGDEIDKEVANAVSKIVKSRAPPPWPRPYSGFRNAGGSGYDNQSRPLRRRPLATMKCFACQRQGHLARDCPNR